MIVEGINEWIREGRGIVVGPNPFKKREIPTATQEQSETEEPKVVMDGEEAQTIPTKSSITVISSTAVEKPIKKRKLMVI